MPGGEHTAEEVADGRRAQAAVGARGAKGASHPGGALPAEVHEPDPHAVALAWRHRYPDGPETHLVEAEAPRVGVVGDQAIGVGAARQRAVHGEGDAVARLLEEGLDQV